MIERIIFAGAGGQGIMVMAKVLAIAAMQADKFVTWLPSYGAEVRGGTARCMLVVSDEKIGSPFITIADTLIAMNQPSLKKYLPNLKPGGTLIINTSLAQADSLPGKNIQLVKIAATEIAIGLGNVKVANMVSLGAYLAERKIVSKNTFIKCLFEIAQEINPVLFEINKKAFEAGFKNN
jgi:2-oxoglutarate ferredoxin oxidoreductase subunit gamma